MNQTLESESKFCELYIFTNFMKNSLTINSYPNSEHENYLIQ